MQQNYNKTASKQILYKMYKKCKKHFSNLYLNDNKITFKTNFLSEDGFADVFTW